MEKSEISNDDNNVDSTIDRIVPVDDNVLGTYIEVGIPVDTTNSLPTIIKAAVFDVYVKIKIANH